MRNQIYIGNLAFTASKPDLQTLCAEFGEIANIHIPVDRASGKPRGFAFVTFADEDAATKSLALNNMQFLNRQIRVNLANSPKEDERGGGAPRSSGRPSGGFGGDRGGFGGGRGSDRGGFGGGRGRGGYED